jgi:hypothetical protein
MKQKLYPNYCTVMVAVSERPHIKKIHLSSGKNEN